MKKVSKLLLGILLTILLSACGSSTTSSSSRTNSSSSSSGYSSSSNSSAQSNNSSSSSSGENQSSNSSSAEFSLPYRAENPPNGVLDQLVWWGTGGGAFNWYIGTSRCNSCSLEVDDNLISLSGFDANQTVYIPLYSDFGSDSCQRGTAEYLTLLTIRVNSSGRADVKLKGNTGISLLAGGVYDANTGALLVKLNFSLDDGPCPNTGSSSSSCPGAPPQKLQVGDKAYVCTRTDSVRLRDGAGKQYSTLKNLVPGADIKIIGGPKCANNWSWWKVETESGYVGWIAEGGDNVDPYFICPK